MPSRCRQRRSISATTRSPGDMATIPNIAVVMPCYRSRARVMDVIGRVGPEVFLIVVVDDACPEGTGAHVSASTPDSRVVVVRNEINLGVGGAVLHGYRVALA